MQCKLWLFSIWTVLCVGNVVLHAQIPNEDQADSLGLQGRSLTASSIIFAETTNRADDAIADFIEASQRLERLRSFGKYVDPILQAGLGAASALTGGKVLVAAALAGGGALLTEVKDGVVNGIYERRHAEELSRLMQGLREKRTGLSRESSEWYRETFPDSGSLGRLHDDRFRSLLDADVKAALVRQSVFIEEVLANLVAGQFQDIQNMEALEEEIVRVEQLTKEWRDIHSSRIKTISDLQQSQVKDVQRLQSIVEKNSNLIEAATLEISNNRNSILKNGKDIRFLQDLMWGRLTPSEQRLALKNEWFPEMSDEEREEYDLKLQVIERQEEISKTASQILNGAAGVLGIAEKLGFDKEVVSTLRSLVNVGHVGVFAAKVFTTGGLGGFIQLGGMIASLFGGPSETQLILEEIRALRMDFESGKRELFAAITDISTELRNAEESLRLGQRQIRRDLREVQRLQGRTLLEIRRLGIGLSELEKKQGQRHHELMRALSGIKDSTWINRELIAYQHGQALVSCAEFLEKRSNFEFDGLTFPNYSARREFFRSDYAFRDFDETYQALRNILSRSPLDDGFNPVLFVTSGQKFEAIENSRDEYVRSVYFPLVRYVRGIERSHAYLVQSLLRPAHSVSELDLKSQLTSEQFQDQALEKGLSSLLNPMLVTEISNMVVQVAPYFELVREGPETTELQTIDELLKRRRTNKVGLRFLKKALQIMNVTIAQQVLLSGDIVIPVMARDFATGFTLARINETEARISAVREGIEQRIKHQQELEAELSAATAEHDRVGQQVSELKSRLMEIATKLGESEADLRAQLRQKYEGDEQKIEDELNSNPPTGITRLRGLRDKLKISISYREQEQTLLNASRNRVIDKKERWNELIAKDSSNQVRLKELVAKLEEELNLYATETSTNNLASKIGRRAESIKYQHFVETLRHNSYLRHNFMVYIIGKSLARKKTSLITFRAALELAGDDYLLRRCLDLPFEYVFTNDNEVTTDRPGGWSVRFAPKVYVAIPNPLEVIEQKMKVPESIPMLVHARRQLLISIVDHQLPGVIGEIRDEEARNQALKALNGLFSK